MFGGKYVLLLIFRYFKSSEGVGSWMLMFSTYTLSFDEDILALFWFGYFFQNLGDSFLKLMVTLQPSLYKLLLVCTGWRH